MSSNNLNVGNEKTKCYSCKKPITGHISKLTCGHNLCLHCLSLSLIQSEFKSISHSHVTFPCYCGKGKEELTIEQYTKLFDSDELNKMCRKHKTKSNEYCKDCKTWICSECKNGFHKDFNDHRLSKEIPKKRNKCIIHDKAIEYYCNECRKELCSTCNKEDAAHTNEHMEIDEYAMNLQKSIMKKFNLQNEDDFKQIIGNSETNYRTELLSEYNKKKSKIEKVIKSFQSLLQKMKDRVDIEIKYATDFFKILNFSYANYFDVLSSEKTPISIFDYILNMKRELQKIELQPIPSAALDAITGLTTKLSERDLVKFNLKYDESSVATQKNVLTFHSGHEDFMSYLYKVNDSLYITGSLDKTMRLFNMNPLDQTLECKNKFTGHEGSIQCICSFDDSQIATGSYDATIKIWNLSSFSLVKTLEGHTKCVRSLSYLPVTSSTKYASLISSGDDASIRVWNLKTYNCDLQVEEPESLGIHNVINIFFGNIIVTGNNNGSISIYNGKTLAKAITINDGATDDRLGITSMIVYKKDNFITGDKEGVIKLYDPENQFECIKTLKHHGNWVTSLLEMKENKVASGGRDEIIKIWDIQRELCLMTLTGHFNTIVGLYLTNHGFIISGGADGLIKVWKKSIDNE